MYSELKEKLDKIIVEGDDINIHTDISLSADYDAIIRIADATYNLALQDKWVGVEDRLPEKSGWYLVFGSYTRDCPQKSMEAIFHSKSNPKYSYFTSTDGIKTKNVTHWMPLPQPPQQ